MSLRDLVKLAVCDPVSPNVSVGVAVSVTVAVSDLVAYHVTVRDFVPKVRVRDEALLELEAVAESCSVLEPDELSVPESGFVTDLLCVKVSENVSVSVNVGVSERVFVLLKGPRVRVTREVTVLRVLVSDRESVFDNVLDNDCNLDSVEESDGVDERVGECVAVAVGGRV